VKIDAAEKFMRIQMMTQMFKSIGGDSKNFQMVMDSLVKAMDISEGTSSSVAMTDANSTISAFSNSSINTGDTNINSAVEKASNKYNVDKDLINAVIKQESSFDPKSTSSSGAMGLMQLMPATAKELGVTNAYDIGQNVDGGTKYLKGLLDMYGNSKELALSAYNSGSGTLNSRGVKDKNDINRLPYETRDYVKKVMKYYGK
jgi:soluble lytic murein transglycosylase-like protein